MRETRPMYCTNTVFVGGVSDTCLLDCSWAVNHLSADAIPLLAGSVVPSEEPVATGW